jgi:hypothetical protein
LKEAREELRERLEEGEQLSCPVCDQGFKHWKQSMVVKAVAYFIALVGISPDGDSVHISSFLTHSDRNFQKMGFWGLIEREKNDNPKKRTSGMWSITKLGIDFVNGKVSVPKYVVTYDGKLVRTEGENVFIRDILNDKFDYEELMRVNFPDR